jgi:hypothetical protein
MEIAFGKELDRFRRVLHGVFKVGNLLLFLISLLFYLVGYNAFILR